MKKDEAISELHKIIDEISKGKFIGVIGYSNTKAKQGFLIAEKGSAEDRIRIVDAIFQSMYAEPKEESKRYYMLEMYKRWKHYFADSFLAELNYLKKHA